MSFRHKTLNSLNFSSLAILFDTNSFYKKIWKYAQHMIKNNLYFNRQHFQWYAYPPLDKVHASSNFKSRHWPKNECLYHCHTEVVRRRLV